MGGVNIYIWMFATIDQIVQLIIRSKASGQPHVQSVWAERHLSSARPWVSIISVWASTHFKRPGRCISIFGCSDQMDKNSNCRNISDWDSLTLTYVDQFLQGDHECGHEKCQLCLWHLL